MPGLEDRALDLLEAEPPGPELVAAHAELAAMRLLASAAYGEAIRAAARALALAAELGLPEPARALGYRGAARCCPGDRDGLSDMRRALQLAIEQGQGHAAATLHNNLAASIWDYEGPQAALERCRDGIAFSERRGVTESALAIAAMSTTFLAEVGQTEQALGEAGPLAERLLADGDISFTEPRAAQLRLLAERGTHEQAPAADELVARARESGEPQHYVRDSAFEGLAFEQLEPWQLEPVREQSPTAALDEWVDEQPVFVGQRGFDQRVAQRARAPRAVNGERESRRRTSRKRTTTDTAMVLSRTSLPPGGKSVRISRLVQRTGASARPGDSCPGVA